MTYNDFQEAAGLSDALALRWFTPIAAALVEFKITTPAEQAAWIAQVGTESGGFTTLRENMNYSAKALKAVFGSRITDAEAQAWGRPDGVKTPVSQDNQAKIANKVYGGRYGNNTTGDGWRYRGGGLKQITFKANYDLCGRALGVDLLANPELVTRDDIAARSACWFWASNKLGRFVRDDDFIGLTKAINGGTNGLADRQARWDVARSALGLR